MVYTLGQAAKAAGKSKSTILKAIKSGRISGEKDDSGDWKINPAELHRVYPLVQENRLPEHQGERQVNTGEHLELKAKLEATEQRLRDSHEQVIDLRRRLDQSEEERRKTQTQLTVLLTDQRQKETPQGFWQRLLRG